MSLLNNKVRPAVAALAALLVLGLSACSPSADAKSSENSITIATDDGQEKHWQVLTKKLKEQGIDLTVKTFSDGTQINTATENGDVDINLFQHLAFLAQYNVNNDGTLVPVGATAVYPLALYSKSIDSVDAIPKKAKIAIPNNPTNQARALRNLQDAGLLTLKGGGDSLSTPAEIESSSVTIVPVDSNQTVNALNGSADLAVVNNTQAQKGGLGNDDIVYKDDLDSGTNDAYINAFVTRDADKDDPRWTKLVDAYHSPEVEDAVSELNGGNLEFKTDWSATKLQKLLKSEEETAKAAR